MQKQTILNYILAISLLLLVVQYQLKDAGTAASESAIEIIHQRKSVRAYTDQPVSRENLETLVRAGMAAPTAMNRQPWAFIAIDDRAILDALADGLRWAGMLRQAMAAIVVCGDLEKAGTGAHEFWVQDCSAATQNILLAAEALGLGAVWTAGYPVQASVDHIRSVLALPAHIVPLATIAIGYPDGDFSPKDKWKPENLRWQKWEQQ